MRLRAGRGDSYNYEVYVNGERIDDYVTADEEAGEVTGHFYCVTQHEDGRWGFSPAYFPESEDPLPTYTRHGRVEIRKRARR